MSYLISMNLHNYQRVLFIHLLLPILSFIALWSDRIQGVASVVLSLGRFVLYPGMWFILENLACAVAYMCSCAV